MRGVFFRLSAVAGAVVCASMAWSVQIFAVDNLGQANAGTVGDRVIRFDSANPVGTVVVLGATGFLNEGMSGLDFSGTGTLYSASGFHAGGGAFPGSKLYTINTTTGAGTLVGSMGLPNGTNVTDLSWNPVTGQMQALTNFGNTVGPNSLYTVNLGTGAASLVGAITGLAGGLAIGLSTNNAGVSFIHDLVTDRMYQLTGLAAAPMASLIGIDTNFSQGMTMNWHVASNDWYLGNISNTPVFASQVRLMNNATGATTSILGTWPNNGASGLPQYETGDLAVVPEPATLAALGIGLAALLRRRRR